MKRVVLYYKGCVNLSGPFADNMNGIVLNECLITDTFVGRFARICVEKSTAGVMFEVSFEFCKSDSSVASPLTADLFLNTVARTAIQGPVRYLVD